MARAILQAAESAGALRNLLMHMITRSCSSSYMPVFILVLLPLHVFPTLASFSLFIIILHKVELSKFII